MVGVVRGGSLSGVRRRIFETLVTRLARGRESSSNVTAAAALALTHGDLLVVVVYVCVIKEMSSSRSNAQEERVCS